MSYFLAFLVPLLLEKIQSFVSYNKKFRGKKWETGQLASSIKEVYLQFLSMKTYVVGTRCQWKYLNEWHSTFMKTKTGPRSTVGNMSGYRCVSDCKSRGREFDPGPVPYFRGD